MFLLFGKWCKRKLRKCGCSYGLASNFSTKPFWRSCVRCRRSDLRDEAFHKGDWFPFWLFAMSLHAILCLCRRETSRNPLPRLWSQPTRIDRQLRSCRRHSLRTELPIRWCCQRELIHNSCKLKRKNGMWWRFDMFCWYSDHLSLDCRNLTFISSRTINLYLIRVTIAALFHLLFTLLLRLNSVQILVNFHVLFNFLAFIFEFAVIF